MASTVKHDRTKLLAYLRRGRRLNRTEILVGQVSSATYPDGTSVAVVAAILEERSGFRERAIRGRTEERRRDLRRLNRDLLRGGDVKRDLKRIGRKDRDAVRRSIRESGHVDTGLMLRSTRFSVVT